MDLVSVDFDLSRRRDMCARITQISADGVLLDSLSVSIPIVYARVFSGGVRNKAQIPVIKILTPEDYVYHQSMLKFRSMHIAHSINQMESQRLRVWLNPEERGKCVNNVNAEHVFLSSLANVDYQRLSAIVEKLSAWVKGEIDAEERRLKPLVEAKYEIDVLYAMKAEISTCGGFESVSEGRHRG